MLKHPPALALHMHHAPTTEPFNLLMQTDTE